MTENPGGGPRPGWYPDPENPTQRRYWDGSRWTGQEVDEKNGKREGFVGAYGRLPRWGQFGIPIVAVVVIVAAAVGGGESKDKSTTSDAVSTTTESSSSSSVSGNPAENASGSNTPRVGPNGSVEVDTLRWRLRHVDAAKTIGNQEYGLGAKANGIFIVAELSVSNGKSESVTLTADTVSLIAGEDTYSADNNAEAALIGEGKKTFLAEDLGPGVTATGTVAFDVAPSVLHQHPELQFNELGFGETHGYIALPPLTN